MPLLDRPKNWPEHLPWFTRSPLGNVVITPLPRATSWENHYQSRICALAAEDRRSECNDELDTLHAHCCELQDALAQRLTVEIGYKDLADARKQTLEAVQAELEALRGNNRVLARMLTEALDAPMSAEPVTESEGCPPAPPQHGSAETTCAGSSETPLSARAVDIGSGSPAGPVERTVDGEVAGSIPARRTSLKPGTVKRLIALLRMFDGCTALTSHERREFDEIMAELEAV